MTRTGHCLPLELASNQWAAAVGTKSIDDEDLSIGLKNGKAPVRDIDLETLSLAKLLAGTYLDPLVLRARDLPLCRRGIASLARRLEAGNIHVENHVERIDHLRESGTGICAEHSIDDLIRRGALSQRPANILLQAAGGEIDDLRDDRDQKAGPGLTMLARFPEEPEQVADRLRTNLLQVGKPP